MDVRTLYNQLLEEIHDDERALGEKRALVQLLQKRIALLPLAGGGAALALPALSGGGGTGKSFVQQVEAVLPAMAGREFVVSDVGDALTCAADLSECDPGSLHSPLGMVVPASVAAAMSRH